MPQRFVVNAVGTPDALLDRILLGRGGIGRRVVCVVAQEFSP
jgi:hypothetical protein